jgi:hypothetical protein
MTFSEMVNFLSVRLKEDMEMNAKFPFDSKTPPEKRRFPRHMRDVALKQNPTYILSPDMHYFEIGNDSAEQNTPHYHILEDAKIIRNPGRGTKKSKGSQRLVGRKSQRDYGQFVYVPSKTTGGFSVIQEYRQNMTRNYDGTLLSKTQPREYSKRKQVSDVNKRNYRYNKHYQYIERILFDVTKGLAIEMNSMGNPVKLKVGNVDSLFDPSRGNQQVAGYLDDNFELKSGFLPDYKWEGID